MTGTTEIRFYHMQTRRLEQVLPEILAKALQRGSRIVVKAGSMERVEALDAALWQFDAASFLPHGFQRDGSEAEQPVWLTTGDDNPNGADILILTDGAASGSIGDYALACEIFDGADDDAVAAARARWKVYKDKGFAVSYFQQDDSGKWTKK
jgi:DNA polymerase III subunit chi